MKPLKKIEIKMNEVADRLLGEVLSCQTSLIEHENFHQLNNGCSAYETIINLWNEGHDSKLKKVEVQWLKGQIKEWWLVTEWLSEKLKEQGEPVLKTDFGYYWGRTTSGQSLKLDSIFNKMAYCILLPEPI